MHKKPALFPQQIYFITDQDASGLSHVRQVELLLAAGARLIQIRDKRCSSHDLYIASAEAVRLTRGSGTLIVVNDRVDIALACGADGVHLGQDDLPPATARELLGANAIIGISTHNVAQAEAASSEPVDYIAIGPVFATSSKLNADPMIGLDGVNRIRQAVGNIPLVAIGGISSTNIASVIAAGADAAAVISSALRPPNTIVENVRTLFQSV